MANTLLISPFLSRRADDLFVKELEDRVSSAIPRSSSFTVTSHKNVSSAEVKFKKCEAQLSCLAKTGRDLGFQWVVAGYVDSSVEGNYLLQIELWNTETSRMERKKEIVIDKDTQSLVVAAEMLTRQLFDSLPLSAVTQPPVILPPAMTEAPLTEELLANVSEPVVLSAPVLNGIQWGGITLGAGGLIFGVVEGILARGSEEDYEDSLRGLEASGDIVRRQSGYEFKTQGSKDKYGTKLDNLRKDGQNASRLANVGYIVGGAVLLVGVAAGILKSSGDASPQFFSFSF